ncbi:MAG: phosphoribosylaminoimidazolesuccinocarboxamide synthase [Stygiobacter sp. RIFOXYC12_FULL_38_8]|nr:MAG: phosphoribosylaminoimidazolesuccinocarboxamide synthase [Stygiobacter sp. GWC2_38_9]OGU81122.1 MAG: phosphoribosylaminoimidazolesuccinocarboxamide synthase [Stygiobacter sp. RIFOXYA12_FULL_38_9]OGV08049.1 MAG: phosphoribosylaminoimidazolesuccinocarboxamide synthase [Stygiobacter sp. RIFOXYB2_FULL_37_11]OGV13079.1 MAG: phosphoribosylaminoimidazolesuccinocarboxamide synthase [Stygiobacter sp. RIFOXYA2_FULL_38_8]OGV15278.1 MAG: phosphoribosylaminoimidazolesuccinocarboxamide synthase [Stygi
MNSTITTLNLPDLKLFKQGKVRDVYDIGEYYLIVSSDRLSAFDVIMNDGIPNKGKVLNQISCFWFDHMKELVENHLVSANVDDYPEVCKQYRAIISGRSMLVKKAELIPIECIVRGYISGTGWNDYKKSGNICGIGLPKGLVESEKLPEPIFTPSTKAEVGVHDENINEAQAVNIIGKDAFEFIKKTAINIYKKASEFALTKGIIIADTKMEFGYFDGKIILIDELLTPDSSRFWPLAEYEKGRAQNSYDKQYVRDYLLSINFNKRPPAPALPEDVILNTAKKYDEALFKLTGETVA